MSYSIPVELITEIQIQTRDQAGLSDYDPTQTSHLPVIPSLAANIASLDPSPPYLRCKDCKGRLIGGVQSLLCIYCGRLNDVAFPDPILFKDTLAYTWLLQSLNLDGSEMVEPHTQKNETPRGQAAPPKDNISLSELLNFQISFRPQLDKVESDVNNKEAEQTNSLPQWNGIELDDFFLESEQETAASVSERPVISTQVRLEGTKSVATDDNPYFSQHTPSAETSVKDDEFSGWQADFQPRDNEVQNTSQLSDTSSAPPVDLSTHIDSVFGSGKGEISITSSTHENWTSDELNNNVNSQAFPQSMDFYLSQSGNNQVQNKVGQPSTSGDWFQADDWGIGNVDQTHKTITTDDDDSFAEWNDFTSSTNAQHPSGSVFTGSNISGAISHEKPSDLTLVSFDDQHNDMDVSGFGRPDLFSDPFSKNDDLLEVNNISAGVSSPERLADLTRVVEDGGEHGVVNVEYSNARTNTTEDVQALISEMHDLSFMLKDDLTIPTKSADSQNVSH